MASGSQDGTIIIWDVKEGEVIRKLNGHQDAVVSLEILKNGNLASGSTDKTIIIWDSNFYRIDL